MAKIKKYNTMRSYRMDKGTLRRLDNLSESMQASRSEVLRRAVQAAADLCQPSSQDGPAESKES